MKFLKGVDAAVGSKAKQVGDLRKQENAKLQGAKNPTVEIRTTKGEP